MYSVYILKSIKAESYYVGHSIDVLKRLPQHNSGRVRSTKSQRPWKIVYTEEYPTKQGAYRRELIIKSYKGGRAFKSLLTATALGGVPPMAA